MKVWVLRGEGIECEVESFRAFRSVGVPAVEYLNVPDVLGDSQNMIKRLHRGDLVFFPGGFSFADHFGAGKLLSFRLQSVGFFEATRKAGVHVMGVCNGFQMLTEAGLFGDVRLKPNRDRQGRAFGFCNRWVTTELMGPLAPIAQGLVPKSRVNMQGGGPQLSLPVRHGEGCLLGMWNDHTIPFLRYLDFYNGSREDVAGLMATESSGSSGLSSGSSGLNRVVIGMMPHPEIALRMADHPDGVGAEYLMSDPKIVTEFNGSGAVLLRSICRYLEEFT